MEEEYEYFMNDFSWILRYAIIFSRFCAYDCGFSFSIYVAAINFPLSIGKTPFPKERRLGHLKISLRALL